MIPKELVKAFPAILNITGILNGYDSSSSQLLVAVDIEEGSPICKSIEVIKPGTYVFISHDQDCWARPSNFARAMDIAQKTLETASEDWATEGESILPYAVTMALSANLSCREDLRKAIEAEADADEIADLENLYHAACHDMPVVLMLLTYLVSGSTDQDKPLTAITLYRFSRSDSTRMAFASITMGSRLAPNARDYFAALKSKAALDTPVDDQDDQELDLEAFFRNSGTHTKH